MGKHVFVPFARNASPEVTKWVKNKALEWRTTKDRGLKHDGLTQPLASVKDGDTIWVQAEGYTNDFTVIGNDGGSISFTPLQLLSTMVNAGLDPALQNIKIKIWACFSGFNFAQRFYNQVVASYPNANEFHGLIVDGYRGATRLAENKLVKPIVPNPAQTRLQSWGGADVAAKGGARVRFGPKP